MQKSYEIAITIGPASRDKAILSELMALSPSFVRINLAHGDFAANLAWIEALHAQYPRMRIYADIKSSQDLRLKFCGPVLSLAVQPSQRLTLYLDFDMAEQAGGIFFPFRRQLAKNQVIWVHDKKVMLTAVEIERDKVVAAAAGFGEIRHNDAAIVEGVTCSFPPTDSEALAQIDVLQGKVEGLLLSHVQSASDVEKVAGHFSGDIISKIEGKKAVENLGDIAARSPAMLIARGDLSMAYSPEELPSLQEIVCRSLRSYPGRLFLATGFFESMESRDRPHFSDIADVFHSYRQGIRGFLLTGETAVGKFPVLSVQRLMRVLEVVSGQQS